MKFSKLVDFGRLSSPRICLTLSSGTACILEYWICILCYADFFFISEHRGIVSPSIVEHTSSVQVAQDEGAVLLCVAQGCPTPEYRYKVEINLQIARYKLNFVLRQMA